MLGIEAVETMEQKIKSLEAKYGIPNPACAKYIKGRFDDDGRGGVSIWPENGDDPGIKEWSACNRRMALEAAMKKIAGSSNHLMYGIVGLAGVGTIVAIAMVINNRKKSGSSATDGIGSIYPPRDPHTYAIVKRHGERNKDLFARLMKLENYRDHTGTEIFDGIDELAECMEKIGIGKNKSDAIEYKKMVQEFGFNPDDPVESKLIGCLGSQSDEIEYLLKMMKMIW